MNVRPRLCESVLRDVYAEFILSDVVVSNELQRSLQFLLPFGVLLQWDRQYSGGQQRQQLLRQKLYGCICTCCRVTIFPNLPLINSRGWLMSSLSFNVRLLSMGLSIFASRNCSISSQQFSKSPSTMLPSELKLTSMCLLDPPLRSSSWRAMHRSTMSLSRRE